MDYSLGLLFASVGDRVRSSLVCVNPGGCAEMASCSKEIDIELIASDFATICLHKWDFELNAYVCVQLHDWHRDLSDA